MSDKQPKDEGEGSKPPSARQERQAEALRANLRRRKAQARGRKAPEPSEAPEPPEKKS